MKIKFYNDYNGGGSWSLFSADIYRDLRHTDLHIALLGFHAEISWSTEWS